MAERKLEFAGRLEIGPNAIQRGSTSDYAAMSMAISAKRQADALERIATVLEKATGGGQQLDPYFFEQAAYQAGLSFERGRR